VQVLQVQVQQKLQQQAVPRSTSSKLLWLSRCYQQRKLHEKHTCRRGHQSRCRRHHQSRPAAQSRPGPAGTSAAGFHGTRGPSSPGNRGATDVSTAYVLACCSIIVVQH